jgi:hypothetical protein
MGIVQNSLVLMEKDLGMLNTVDRILVVVDKILEVVDKILEVVETVDKNLVVMNNTHYYLGSLFTRINRS